MRILVSTQWWKLQEKPWNWRSQLGSLWTNKDGSNHPELWRFTHPNHRKCCKPKSSQTKKIILGRKDCMNRTPGFKIFSFFISSPLLEIVFCCHSLQMMECPIHLHHSRSPFLGDWGCFPPGGSDGSSSTAGRSRCRWAEGGSGRSASRGKAGGLDSWIYIQNKDMMGKYDGDSTMG